MSHYDPGVLTPDSGKILGALLKEATPILNACRAHAELRDDGLLQGSCMIRGYPFTFVWQIWRAPWGWSAACATGNEGLPGADYKTHSGITGGTALFFMLKRLQQNAAPLLPAGGASLTP